MNKPIHLKFSTTLFIITLLLAVFYALRLFFYMIGDPIFVNTPAEWAEYRRAGQLAVADFLGSCFLSVGMLVYLRKGNKPRSIENENL